MDLLQSLTIAPKCNRLFILLTNKCNIECSHCYVSSGPNEPIGISRMDLVDIISKLISLNKDLEIILSGGEVFVRKRDVLFLIEEFSDQKFLILTNGMLITEKIAARIATFQNVTLRISLDGHSSYTHDRIRGKGAYDRAIRGISMLKKHGVEVRLSATIEKSNVIHIPSILLLAESLSIDRVKIEPIAKTGRAVLHFGEIEPGQDDAETQQFRGFIKGFDSFNNWKKTKIDDNKYETVTVYSNGDIYPYTYYNEVDKATGYCGNIYSDDIKAVITSEKYKESILHKILVQSIGPPQSMGAFEFINMNNG